ncbi:MAG: tetratricopeptide (TPR) repeat protein, partial [Planctomycetota bacterium]
VPQDGLVWWYRAWVGIVLGERSRLEVDWETAEEELAQAARWAETAAERAPEHADGARRLRHRALLGTALCALAQNQDAIARERLTALLANAPDLRNESEGLGRSVISGLGTLGSHYVDNADFGAGAELALLVLEVLPDQASWWNNLGYMLRQHACYIQGAGDPAAARELFSESWSAYQRAVALNSESVRYTNDAALIQVYHLRDELPRAERMLLSAIAMGETQLDALGPDPEESARFPLALAVGDALENLGYLYYHVQPDPQNSRAFYERSLATDSGARWTVLEHLAALRGERDPVDEWPVAGRAPGEPAPAALIDWECSFDGARLRAELEGRPVFLYYRGAALSGLDGDFWLNALEQDGLASRLDATVPVVADLVRHTIGDRRRDGTRIACPRYGGIPCSAHVRAAQEFARFFAERNDGAGPGGNQEHFHLLNADGDELEWNEAFLAQIGLGEGEVTEEVALELPTPQPTRSRQQSRTDLVAATRGADAETLRRYATASTTAERAALEGFLFDSSAPDTERGAILSALAASFDDDSRALLAAGLHQTHDSQLQALAAASWSNGEDVAPLMRTLQWGLSEAAREAARQRLHDLASGAESLRYLAVAAR